MVGVAAAACLCVLGATGDLGLDASVGLRAGVRRGSYGVDAPSTLGEVELLPALGLGRDGRLRVSARYAPRLLVPLDVSGGMPELQDGAVLRQRASVTHDARLAVDAQNATWTLKAAAEGVYGDTDLVGRPEIGAQPVPGAFRFPYVFARTIVGLEGKPTRRLSYSVQGSATLTGGAAEAARSALPLQRAIQLDAGAGWSVTRRDALSGLLTWTGSRVEGGNDASYVGAGGAWRRLVRPTLVVSGSAGMAATFSRARGVVPWGGASLRFTPEPPRPSARLDLTVAPGIDHQTGAVNVTSTLDARTSWPVAPRWSLDARAFGAARHRWSGLETLWSGPDTLLGLAELSATRWLRRLVTASVSLRASAQRSEGGSLLSFGEVGAFLEIAARSASRL